MRNLVTQMARSRSVR